MPEKAKYTYNIPRYEMARLDKMKQNQEKIDALGLKHISTSLKDTTQSNCAKGKRSRASVVVNDDYVPLIGDDDNDDESSNSVIHKVYKKLVQSHGADYARSHPPKNVKLELWTELIDERWTNEDWLKKSRKNSANRNKISGKHRCGTKALAVRVDEEINNNNGQVLELAKIFKDVHFNSNTNMWIHHEDEATYENILKVQEDHCQDPNAIPLIQEEISNLVFKKKFSIVKRLGMRPSSSLVTIASSNSSVEYIQRLENEILEFKKARVRDQEERAREQEERVRDQEARAKQEEVQKNILNFLRSKGYDDALT
ncbi:hypothetical protein SO802_005759 [Lithocarpus litseifolius]|uniref:Transposase, Ptta/En/Spm, plant n=1 Tax=Lithocarpus litseifolius TaxID=425828 RepID=A0AAW2DNP4_9ROSI